MVGMIPAFSNLLNGFLVVVERALNLNILLVMLSVVVCLRQNSVKPVKLGCDVLEVAVVKVSDVMVLLLVTVLTLAALVIVVMVVLVGMEAVVVPVVMEAL